MAYDLVHECKGPECRNHQLRKLFLRSLALGILFCGPAIVPFASASDTVDPEVTPASEQASKKDKKPAPTVAELLQTDPELLHGEDTPRCINTHRIRDSEVIDEQHVAFRVSRDEYYLVQFKRRCPGLRRGNPLYFETRMNRLCEHDVIRGSYSSGVASFEPGMPCAIPEFQKVTKEQIVMLKDALKVLKRQKKAAKVKVEVNN